MIQYHKLPGVEFKVQVLDDHENVITMHYDDPAFGFSIPQARDVLMDGVVVGASMMTVLMTVAVLAYTILLRGI